MKVNPKGVVRTWLYN